jgi:hypothetical protein
MQAEKRAADYNADKKKCAGGRTFAAERTTTGESEWKVVTYLNGKPHWNEYV